MDFFEAQREARKRTRWLYALYVIGVLLMASSIYMIGAAAMYYESLQNGGIDQRFARGWLGLWDAQLFGILFGGTVALIVASCLYKITALGRGAFTVATSMGGRRVDPDSKDAEERRLLNVVEEMAIASGMPVPDVYVLDNEPGINAFAAGFSPSDAVICVTQGTLKILKRDELQGVIGHEFSHLLNGDSAINVRAIGLLFGILIIRLIGESLFRSARYMSRGRGKNNPGPALLLLGVMLIIIGSVGAFFARMLQAAISRQREVLADASAVQFTRDTNGLAAALKKIGGYVRGSNIYSPHAIEARHMFFADATWSKFVDFRIFKTHPPIEERIKRLDPSWNGEFSKVDYESVAEEMPSPFAPRNKAGEAFHTGVALAAMEQALQQIGDPTDNEVEQARVLCGRLPVECLKAAHDPQRAPVLVLSLLLSSGEQARTKQMATIAQSFGEAGSQQATQYSVQLQGTPSAARLALINLAIPVLKHLPDAEYQQFTQAIEAMIRSDDKVSLFEYALRHTLKRHLTRYREQIRPPAIAFRNVSEVADSAAVLLSAMAWFGSNYDEATARSAFAAGATAFDLRGQSLAMKEANECNLQNIDNALKHYERTAEMLKKNLLFAAAKVVSFDGKLIDREAELLRAIGDALDCPIPPIAYQT